MKKKVKKKRKVLKIILWILLGIVVVVAGLVIWQWESLNIMLNNAKISGPVNMIPIERSPITPISRGESDWICWRGQNGDGRSSLTNIPKDWSKGLKKRWEISFLCQGQETSVWSAPVVQGNRLIVCGRDETKDLVFCLNPEDGSIIWLSSYPAEAGASYGSGSRATPWIDNTWVYTFGRSGDLVCWNLEDGSKVWHRKVAEHGGQEPTWGLSSSPLVTDELVLVSAGGTARTIAFDKQNGEDRWKSGTGLAGYAALQVIPLNEEKIVLSFHGTGLAGIALKDGRELWNMAWKTDYDVHATTPVYQGDLVFMTSGYGTGCQLIKVKASGSEVVWNNKTIASHHSDPFFIDGFIYGYSGISAQNRGYFKCLDMKTGEEKWSTREMGWGTALYVDGHLLCMDIKGNLFLMKPDPQKFVLATQWPKALGKIRGAAWTIPVVANSKLFLRFKQKLICYQFDIN